MPHELLRFSEEVQSAINTQTPIVALEANPLSYGASSPDNLDAIHQIEQCVRNQGAVPATIAIHEGHIHIGVESMVMRRINRSDDVMRASKRDLSYALSQHLSAYTTVAATMFCANLAQLPIMVTSGIGSVHHDEAERFDLSVDLIELSNTPITVVCSGAKSILDLPKTVEMLKTHHVAIVGYQTDELPAFYSHASGITQLNRLDTAKDIAQLMAYQRKLGLKNGILIANPIPKAAEIPDDQIMPIMKQAQQEAKHINGKAITPFFLKRIAELSAGQSLRANFELIKNNATLGANIAMAYQNQLRFWDNVK